MNNCGDSLKEEQDLFHGSGGGSIPTSPLQFKIVKLNPFTASEYNKKWHSRLPRIHPSCITRNTHYICFGASFNNKCFAVAIWSSPVAQNRFKEGKKILELRRLAISSQAPKNTASRMLSVMVKIIKKTFPDINRLISYQDTEVHKGIIYKASGWVATTNTPFVSWQPRNQTHNPDQSRATKIRWELFLTLQKG